MLSAPQLPGELRVQVFKLMEYSFGKHFRFEVLLPIPSGSYDQAWDNLVQEFEYQKGRQLYGQDSIDKIRNLLDRANMGDFITITTIFLEQARLRYLCSEEVANTMKHGDCLAEINRLFKEYKLQYEFNVDDAGNAHAIDKKSAYLHEETIAKATSLLTNAGFQGPLEEFETASDDFTKAEYKDAVLHAHHALDGTMQAILDKRNYVFDPLKLRKIKKPTAAHRIQALIDEWIFHKSLNSLFQSAGTIRNVVPGAGHTQGISPKSPEPSCASLELHLCGTLIVYLIERYTESLKGKTAII